jgi:cytochrome P450
MPTQTDLFAQILDYTNRANPYPLYAELRKTPVVRAQDGSYVVSTYREVVALLHDPRIGKRNAPRPGQERAAFIDMDPPEHDRLRRLAVSHFEQSEAVRPELQRIVAGLIDRMRDRQRIDVVDDFAYPFPVTMICARLGVPREDEARFHPWAEAIVAALDPRPGQEQAAAQEAEARARTEMTQYMSGLVDRFRTQPGTGLLSELAVDEGMATEDIVATGQLLLVAGHETTVNLIANGMLTLLRHPGQLDRLRRDPDLQAIPLIEELLRYEPPVQLLPAFVALDDVEVAGVTIPRGSRITLALAAANRDPNRFPDPEQFDPDRRDNEHLGYLGGIHYCFGAPLARQEVQVALAELACRLENPRLVEDPPPYRQSAGLRGPRHLSVEIDGIHPAEQPTAQQGG